MARGENITLEGLDEIREALDQLGGPEAERIRQDATLAGAEILVPVMQSQTPVGPARWITPKASPRYRTPGGRLKKSVDLRFARGQQAGSIDPNVILVGPVAPHRHLVIRGTQARYTKGFVGGGKGKAAYRGVMPANPFVDRATEMARGAIEREIVEVASGEMDAIWEGGSKLPGGL